MQLDPVENQHALLDRIYRSRTPVARHFVPSHGVAMAQCS